MIRQPTGFKAGAITVGTTVVQGPNVAIAPGEMVSLTASPDNTASIWVGDSGVSTTNGFELVPGSGIAVKVDNLNKLYFISSAASQKIFYACEVT